ncbi:MAG: T9SS type A sorting domain-containing protein [Bacteroidia bacterium]|nr:T9SS type A sorting domain-containing protein [Bacteroidia bacterium]MCZ2277245.1 T9SS type A sorting domain-containing protein [Bacteroidia bacterium]
MQKQLIILIITVMLTFQGFAHDKERATDPYKKIFITNTKWQADAQIQTELKNSASWQHFVRSHGNWKVLFNEHNGLPLIASGKPVQGLFSNQPEEIATSFLTNELAAFDIPRNELVLRSVIPNKKLYYVHYKQVHQGLEVIGSKVRISMSKDGRINSFSLDVRNQITLNLIPSINSIQAEAAAAAGMHYVILQSKSETALKILPVPAGRNYLYHLVYEVFVDAQDDQGFPVRYYTLVDAHNSEVLYRQNRIHQVSSKKSTANMDLNMEGTVYPTNPYNPSAIKPLQHLKVVVGGTTYYTDTTGYLGLTNTTPAIATISLSGRWANVKTGLNVPTFTTTLNPGQNTVTFDNDANIKELTAYWSVQQIHDYYKSIAAGSPAENALDFMIQVKIDVSGNCNAFYDGGLNFYAAGGGCNATSLIPDVVYHEYGHGINYDVYDVYSGSWDNSAMGEGYGDLWANAITEDPVLGIGFFQNDPNGYVRRYDINPKVYPQDLMGESHADGEIIAGAWWDVGVNFGSQQTRMALLWETYAALCTANDGDEGYLFTDILYNTLLIDDDDFDLSNGTPHYCEITSAFARHGIYETGATSELNHTEVLTSADQTPITINASLTGFTPNASITGYYKSDGQGAWVPFTLNNTTGLNYSGTIPPQPAGTILHYYLDYVYSCSSFVNSVSTLPVKANASNPNIPFFILINYNLLNSNELESNTGWTIGLPGDDAVTGQWIIAVPVASYISGNSGVVQPGSDHTPAPGTKCAVTGNAQQGAAAGTNDVDDGKTTLISPSYDLTSYSNPVFTYWRWYSNDLGANPGTDFWQVAVSNDGGNTWTDIENTKVSDNSWRRFAFRVSDYVTPSADVKIRFIAEDALPGSLVEALVDDLELWDVEPTGVPEYFNLSSFNVYPIPAENELNITFYLNQADNLQITLNDLTGREIQHFIMKGNPGFQSLKLPVNSFATGAYVLKIKGEITSKTQRIVIE